MAAKRKVKKKIVRKNIARGIIHIVASFNNTLVTVSDEMGNAICWSSAGSLGFKGSKKSTPFAAQQAVEDAIVKAKEHGIKELGIKIQGSGNGREMAVKAVGTRGDIRVVYLKDNTLVTVSDEMGNAICWSSAGSLGFKGSKTINDAGHEVTVVNTAIVDEDGNAYKVDFESNGEALKGVNYTPLKSGEAINMQSLVSPVTSGISINDFRNVNAYQRYLELNQFRGFSYKEIIEGRFDVNVRYDALNMPEYLGGITRDIIVNPITQTVETVNTGAYVGSLGSQAGLATCS